MAIAAGIGHAGREINNLDLLTLPTPIEDKKVPFVPPNTFLIKGYGKRYVFDNE